MNYFLLVLVLPFFLGACTTLSHSPESKPLYFKDGVTQVQVKFDEDEKALVGGEVTALNKECVTRYVKDREKLSCLRKLAGIGRIVGINNQVATVEFTAGAIFPDTEYEVLTGEVTK